jgi:hypothetical protein
MTTAQDRARNRRIATCYDRLACDFLTTICIAEIIA